MKNSLLWCIVGLALAWGVYKASFSAYYFFILYIPGFIFRSLHPVAVYRHVEMGHVSQPSPVFISKDGSPIRRPNIILIVADDLGVNDLSGNAGVLTPNIDSIANNGVNFINAYAGQATCAPSRASLYTGRYPSRFGFEFTPVTKLLARMLAMPKENAVHSPYFHEERVKYVPPMTHMVVPRNQTMIAEMLQDEGYLTYFLGKWHLGETPGFRPQERGFTESLCFLMGASQYIAFSNTSLVAADLANNMFIDDFLRINLPFFVSHNGGEDFKPNEYMTDYLSKAVVNLIRNRARYNKANGVELNNVCEVSADEKNETCGSEQSDEATATTTETKTTKPSLGRATPHECMGPDGKLTSPPKSSEEYQPFFVTMAYNAPHNPLQALHDDFYSAELNETFDGPVPFQPRGETHPLVGRNLHTARVYAAMIKSMDRGVGLIIDALKETDQYNNTLIIFTSDNGAAAYLGLSNLNYPYRGWKASFFEGGIRVPLFMQWPEKISRESFTADEQLSLLGSGGGATDSEDDKDDEDNILPPIPEQRTFNGLPVTPLKATEGQIVSHLYASHVDIFATIQAAANEQTRDAIVYEPVLPSPYGVDPSLAKSAASTEDEYHGDLNAPGPKIPPHYIIRLVKKTLHAMHVVYKSFTTYILESIYNASQNYNSADHTIVGRISTSQLELDSSIVATRVHRILETAAARLTKHVTRYERAKKIFHKTHDQVKDIAAAKRTGTVHGVDNESFTELGAGAAGVLESGAAGGEHIGKGKAKVNILRNTAKADPSIVDEDPVVAALLKSNTAVEAEEVEESLPVVMIDGIDLMMHVKRVQKSPTPVSTVVEGDTVVDENATVTSITNSSSTNPLLERYDHLQSNNVSIHERVLFWRSGHYAAILQSHTHYKLQVSEMHPNKIWLTNLRTDSTELRNVAVELFNVTTTDDLELFHGCYKANPKWQSARYSSEKHDFEYYNLTASNITAQSCADYSTLLTSITTTTAAAANKDKAHQPSSEYLMLKLFELYATLARMQTQQSIPLWPALIEFPVVIDKNAMEDEDPRDEYIYWDN